MNRFSQLFFILVSQSLPLVSQLYLFSTPYSSEIKENRVTKEGNLSQVRITVEL